MSADPFHVHDRLRREIERNETLAKQRANESAVHARVAASLQDVLDRSIRDAKASAAVDAARVVFDSETGIGEEAVSMEEIVWHASFSTRRLSEKEVLDALILAGLVKPGGKVELSFEVPSGGDYSGMRLRLEDSPLVVTASCSDEVKP